MPGTLATQPVRSGFAGAASLLFLAAVVWVQGCEAPSGEVAAPAAEAKQFLNLPYRSEPGGYTHVVTSPPGTMVFLSGAGGSARDGSMPADFRTQARHTFENLKAGLELAGGAFGDVVKINYFLADMADLAELREVRADYLNMDAPPAATAVQVGLGGSMLLEVDLIAVIPQ